MKVRRSLALLVFLFCFLTPCFAHHMAVVVNKENEVGNVSAVHLARIFRAEVRKWPDAKPIIVVVHSNSAGEDETLQRLLKMTPGEWKVSIAAHRDSIQIVDTDADVLKTVQAIPGAIGLVDVRAVDGAVNVVRVDGKLPMESGYLPH
ncbi:MAG TPA: substrate-binding domain-containing protein [Candidatus Sulfotelmatobacter sp.]|jgi:ABC-type phosphate transport system substrate-binding protein